MKHLGVDIEVKATTELVGTVEWLRNKIEDSEFRFSSTKQDEPCVVWDFFHIVNGERKKKSSKIVAFIDSEYDEYYGWNTYKDCKITNPSHKNENMPMLFYYLTDNAVFHCNRLIEKLADALMNKVSSDKESLKVNVSIK